MDFNGDKPKKTADQFVSGVIKDLPFSGIRKFFDYIAECDDIISLGVGEPDYLTPPLLIDACRSALNAGKTKYTSNGGMPELREEIASYLQRRFGVTYHQDQILVTTGVSEATDLALRTIINQGDEILIAEPCYVSYVPATIIAGGVPVIVPAKAEEQFRIRREDLLPLITERTKAILISYPNNPTGAIMTREDLEQVAQVARDYNLMVISDEVYAELTYEDKHVSIASLPDMKERTIVLNGFSKAFAMTGWRLGYAAGPEPVIEAMLKIHQYTMLCAPSISQSVAVTALRKGFGFVEEMVNEYNERRRFFIDGLRGIGLPCFEPRGAFYAFPGIGHTGLTAEEFSEQLLFEEKVAVIPGNAFGASGEGFVRCCYATSRQDLSQALERMERFLKRHHYQWEAVS